MKRREIEAFQKIVWEYYDRYGRNELPWRKPEPNGELDPYKVMVSELMLQQTQVPRVVHKYSEFLYIFPTTRSLASSSLGDVLRVWQGLGYNRRAKFLWQAAQKIEVDFDGTFPRSEADLISLPGIGKNTAGAIMAYAFNEPIPFVETNIRTVFIHHFFADNFLIHDKQILKVVSASLPENSKLSREWYWALMDYGSYLKKNIGNLNVRSKHYVKQSAFHGSRRQIRGAVLRMLAKKPHNLQEIGIQIEDQRLEAVLKDLVQETLVKEQDGIYSL